MKKLLGWVLFVVVIVVGTSFALETSYPGIILRPLDNMFRSDVSTAKRLCFIGGVGLDSLLRGHPQVQEVTWDTREALGGKYVVAMVRFNAPAVQVGGYNLTSVTRDRVGVIVLSVGKTTGSIVSVTSTGFRCTDDTQPCADVNFLLKSLQDKTNLAYGFWGFSEGDLVALIQCGY